MVAQTPPATRVRRHPERGEYDMAAAAAVFDACPISHIATIRNGFPVALPMMHARLDDHLVVHGSMAAGLFRDMRRDSPVCVTATLFDGLVLARSARKHSMNYRSAVVYGEATPIDDPARIEAAMQAMIERFVPGRWEQVRQPTREELRDTGFWQVPMDHCSVKIRDGNTIEDESDHDRPVWAGYVPARRGYGTPVPADHLPSGLSPPEHLRGWLTVLP